jgi:hypothetical protein
MKNMTDIELIAEFMNINIAEHKTRDNKSYFYLCDDNGDVDYTSFDCKIYDPYTDWNELIAIIKKTEEVNVTDIEWEKLQPFDQYIGFQLIDLNQEECVNACVEFIKEYNKIKNEIRKN